MAGPMQLLARKLPPVPRPGFGAGNEGGRGARAARYVHKIGTSPKLRVFRGTTAEGVDITRRNRRDDVTRQVVNSLERCGREKQAKALATCGEWFDAWHKEWKQVKLLPCPCDSMFCPDCANRRSVPLQKKLLKLVNRPGRSYWFLTLTIPNQPDLTRWDVAYISGKFAELCSSWVFKAFEDEAGKPLKIFGGARSIECVYEPETKEWHPHIHVLLECPKRLPWWWLILLKAKWLALTGDARYLNLQRAYSVMKSGKKKYGRLNHKALREVCKYVTKCAEFAGDHLLVDEFLTAFTGARRIQCFGSFHGKRSEEDWREPGEDDEGIGEAEEKLREQGYVKLPEKVHISDTEVLPDGTRQLKFAFVEKMRALERAHDPPWWLEPEVVSPHSQSRIGFAGVMPAESVSYPSLFAGAA